MRARDVLRNPLSGKDQPSKPTTDLHVPLIVARVTIGREIEFRTYPKNTVLVVPVGTSISIRFPYKFRERSDQKDHWRFFLDCRMGRNHPPAVVVQRTDTPGVTDSDEGILERSFLMDRPGARILDFELGAEYVRSDWRSAEVRHWEQRITHGSLRIDVV